MLATAYNFTTALSNWWLLIWMTMGQLLASYGKTGGRLAFMMALLEPLMLIGGVYLIRGIMKEFGGIYGTSMFLFLASGCLPFYLFMQISSRTRKAGRQRGFPRLSALDVYIASVLINAIVWVTTIVLVFAGMWLSGIGRARPASIVECTYPILLLIVLGAGMGMINNVVGRYIPLWQTIYRFGCRGLIFLSAVFHIVETQPMWLREFTLSNPLTHAIMWFRVGVYGHFPDTFLDRDYLVEFALIVLFLGFVLDRATIRGSES